MKTKRSELFSILAISLILTSSYAVSAALPEMTRTFRSCPASAVDLLITLPSVPLILMIGIGPVLDRLLPEKPLILAGLLCVGIGGTAPCFFSSYPSVMAARIVMGIGLGLINAKAVSMIGERTEGHERARLLGIRQSLETLGQTALTFVAGRLILGGWNKAFAIYASALPLFILFLVFVPSRKARSVPAAQKKRGEGFPVRSGQGLVLLQSVLFAAFLISTNSVMALRLPQYFEETGIGTASQSGTVLSLSTFAGFIGGIAFGSLLRRLYQKIAPLFLLVIALSMLGIALFPAMGPVIALSIAEGFADTICISYMFTRVAMRLPAGLLNLGNSLAIIGCNLGGILTPAVTRLIGMCLPGTRAVFAVYGALHLIMAASLALWSRKIRVLP